MTTNRNTTILMEPEATLSNILISANLSRIEANIDGYQKSNGSLSRMFLEFKCLWNRFRY